MIFHMSLLYHSFVIELHYCLIFIVLALSGFSYLIVYFSVSHCKRFLVVEKYEYKKA